MCSDVATNTPGMCDGRRALPRIALERRPARQPQDGRREAGPRIPVAKIEREQKRQRRRPFGERRDVVERLKAGEESERGGDAENHARAHEAGRGLHHRDYRRPTSMCVKGRSRGSRSCRANPSLKSGISSQFNVFEHRFDALRPETLAFFVDRVFVCAAQCELHAGTVQVRSMGDGAIGTGTRGPPA